MYKRAAFILSTILVFVGVPAAHAGSYGEPVEAETEAAQATTDEDSGSDSPGRPLMREYAGFITDAETLRGFWAGLDGRYQNEDDLFEGDLWTVTARLAYGGEMWEAGIELPYYWLEESWYSSDGLGDMQMWGKFLPIRTDLFQAGGGVVFGTPTGDNSESDEWRFQPFLTGAVAAGPVSLRGMLGYTRYVDHNSSDGVVYNVAALAPCGERVVLRAEFDGAHYIDFHSHDNPVSFVPGVDVAWPLGIGEILLRISGEVGLTNETADWGLGLGVSYAQL